MYARPRGPVGVGLGLRFDHLPAIARGAADGRVAFFELTPENYLFRGDSVSRNLHRVAERAPLLSHGLSLSLGGVAPLDEPFVRALGALLRELGVPYHSDHLCFSAHGTLQFHDLLPLPFTAAAAEHVARRTRRVAELMELPMLLENITYYDHVGTPELTEAAFITRVLRAADCGLLLDLNNLHVNALNFGFDPFDVLAQLPLDRVVQVHVAGPEQWDTGLWVDTHGSAVPERVHALLFALVRRIGPVPVLLERDHALPELELLLHEVDALADVYARGLRAHAQAELAHVG